jgi:hypothetical protein
MMRRFTWISHFLCACALIASTTRDAKAQLGFTVYGVGEFDTSDVIFVLGGVSVSRARAGWTPVAGLSASWLQYPVIGDETQDVTTITPTIGLANNFGPGIFQLSVGYAISNADDDLVAPVVAGDPGQDGVVTIGQVDYWGDGGLGGQAIASYNFGSESLWARGRVTQRIASLSNQGQIRLGGEVAFLDSDFYQATQIGGVIGFHAGRGTIINGGIGRKLAGDDGEDATYFRAEIVLFPR